MATMNTVRSSCATVPILWLRKVAQGGAGKMRSLLRHHHPHGVGGASGGASRFDLASGFDVEVAQGSAKRTLRDGF